MSGQESEEEVRPWERAVAATRRMVPDETQPNWRAGYLLCIGTGIGYGVAAWIEAVAGTL